jgi:branched-chain amino acid transport system substrate-binding protein
MDMTRHVGSPLGVMARRGLVLAAAMALAGSAAACGSSGGGSNSPSSGTSGGSNSASAAKAPSGAPYVIGNLTNRNNVTFQNPVANTATPVAWADWTNAHGGINGHPVKVISFDTQSNNAEALVDAKKLVEQDHVIALAGDNDPISETAYVSYLSGKGIPVVGSAHSITSYTNSDWFPTAPSDYAVFGPAVIKAVKQAGIKRFGLVYCTETPLCLADVNSQATAAKPAGITIATKVAAAIASPNYTAACIKLKQANVQGIYYSAIDSAIAALATDCQQQGVTPKYFFLEPGPDIVKVPAIIGQGAAGIAAGLPYWAAVPANDDYHQAMAQYEPNVALTQDSQLEWGGLEVLKAALEEVPNDPMTPATVKAGLYKLPAGFTADGQTVPLTYTKGKLFDPNCVFLWTLDSKGQYNLTQGTTPYCTSSQ